MKKLNLILVCMLLIFYGAFGQEKLNEKQVIKKSHIDFSKEVIYFELSGLIEIDGHTFKNDTCKSPIIYTSNLEGISIFDKITNQKYIHRKCDVEGCIIIHLVKEQILNDYLTSPNTQWDFGTDLRYVPDSTLIKYFNE